MARPIVAILLLVFIAAAGQAADTLRGGSKIVKTGMSRNEVLQYCGEPSLKEVEEQAVRSGNRVTGVTEMPIWTYARSTAQTPAVLRFDVDELISIDTRKK